MTYTPTLGMYRALSDAPGVTALDYEVCRRRGLLDMNNMPTPRGREVIQRRLRRVQELRGAPIPGWQTEAVYG